MDTVHGAVGLQQPPPVPPAPCSWQWGYLLGNRASLDGRVRVSLSSPPTESLLFLVGMFHP